MIDIINKLLQFLSDNMYPQFKTWEQLLQDTNYIFKWDRLLKEDYQIAYEKALKYVAKKDFYKASMMFAEAAGKGARTKNDDWIWGMMYCSCESILWYGNPEALVQFCYDMQECFDDFPKWMDAKMGICGIAHCLLGEVKKEINDKKHLFYLSGWFLMQYFEKTGYFKNYANELPYYIIFGYVCYMNGGEECLLSYAMDVKQKLPKEYALKVFSAWKQMKIIS